MSYGMFFRGRRRFPTTLASTLSVRDKLVSVYSQTCRSVDTNRHGLPVLNGLETAPRRKQTDFRRNFAAFFLAVISDVWADAAVG